MVLYYDVVQKRFHNSVIIVCFCIIQGNNEIACMDATADCMDLNPILCAYFSSWSSTPIRGSMRPTQQVASRPRMVKPRRKNSIAYDVTRGLIKPLTLTVEDRDMLLYNVHSVLYNVLFNIVCFNPHRILKKNLR